MTGEEKTLKEIKKRHEELKVLGEKEPEGSEEKKIEEQEKKEKEIHEFGPEKVLKMVLRWIAIALLGLFFTNTVILLIMGWDLTRTLVSAIGVTALTGLLIGAELYRSKVKVPAQPHSVGIITFLGSKKDHLRVTDGVYPSIGGTGKGTGILDYLIVEAQQVDQDFNPQSVITKDGIGLVAEPMIYWIPDLKHLREYIIAGGKDNVMVLLDNKVPQLTTNWCKSRDLDDVLELAVKEVEKILGDLITCKVGVPGDRTDGMREKTVQELLGIKIIDFNLNIGSVDPDALSAMKQKKIEDLQRTSETTEIETEILQANQLCEEAKKRGEDMTFEKAYKIVKIIKTNRELGVAPVLGLDDAFGKGTASIADAALMAFTGLMKKPVEGEPFDVAKGQQKPLARKPQDKGNKNKAGAKGERKEGE